MSKRRNRGSTGSSGVDSAGKFEGVQVGRDLETNWEVDVAEKLEDYLLKICSGVLSSSDDVNFAEAALLLQGSVQVYSRKVEYLYSLVLQALDFLARKSQEDAPGEQSASANEHPNRIYEESNEDYWEARNFPVEPRNCLEVSTSGDPSRSQFVRPPLTLVVIEGDCFDTSADAEELESFVMGSASLYKSFILLDPNDSVSVDEYLAGAEFGFKRGSVSRSMSRKSFVSPAMKSAEKGQNRGQSPIRADSNVEEDLNEFETDGFEESNVDEDDPWKPLNPHENGTLKVKPFSKVNSFRTKRRQSEKSTLCSVMFPTAKIFGPISPEFNVIWEEKFGNVQKSNTLYDKLRESLLRGSVDSSRFADHDDEDDYNHSWESGDFGDFNDNNNEHEQEIPKNNATPEINKRYDKTEREDQVSQATLEELCRSHLNVLLANIAETEKQADIASRVATWKQKIDHNLEESHPPFDIHACGETIISKLSRDTSGKSLSFGDVVKGQEKHDVARTFSALLQLINNGEVRLKTGVLPDAATCYSAANPFVVELQGKEGDKKKRVLPTSNGCLKSDKERPVVSIRNDRTPEGKKRRRSIPLVSS